MTTETDVWRLVHGVTDLATAPQCLVVLWAIAFGEGRCAMLPALEQAQADADRYYRAALDSGAHKQLVDRVLDSIDVQQYRRSRKAA